jgi:predicted permease
MKTIIRPLLRQPGFSAAVILLVALGVGAGTAVFTVVNELLLTAPPLIADPESIVRLNSSQPAAIGIATYPDYVHARDQQRVFSHLFAYDGAGTPVQLRRNGVTTDGDVRFVTGNYFGGLGVHAAAGRTLTPNDDEEHAEPAAMISEGLQQRWFSSAQGALGQSMDVNGQRFNIVGVVPSGFLGASRDDLPVDVWIPVWKRPLVTGRPRMDMVRTPNYVHSFLVTMGRLRPGTSIEQAQAQLDVVTRGLVQFYEGDRANDDVRVTVSRLFSLSPNRRASVVTLAKLIGSLAAIVVLIVCANLANLMLARAITRRGEVTVKLALGAGRVRLLQQLAAETGILVLAGGAVGVLCAYWAAHGLASFLPFELAAAPRPDLRVFAFALTVATLTAVACGIAPAWLTTKLSAAHTSGARTTGGGAAARTSLVITQVALCFVLLVTAALFVRTLNRIQSVPLGFNPQGVLSIALDLRAHGYDAERSTLMYERIAERFRSLPGVQSVALGSIVPLSGSRRTSGVRIEGRPVVARSPVIDSDIVSPGYFRTVGMSLLRGRDFQETDRLQSPHVIVINESMAKRYWPNQDPIGKRILPPPRPNAAVVNDIAMEVIGVVADARTSAVTEQPVPMFFRPAAQSSFPRMVVYLRTGGDPIALVDAARRALAELDPNIVPRSIRTLEDVHADRIRSFTANARLVTVLGAIALILAALGLYAVTSYLVTQRTREFGLRLAIGAQPTDLLRDVLGNALQRAGIGIVIGILGALALVEVTERFVFDLSPTDIGSYGIAAAVLATSVTLATLLPAKRATQVDPMVALRTD